eukprot:IDg20911t1
MMLSKRLASALLKEMWLSNSLNYQTISAMTKPPMSIQAPPHAPLATTSSIHLRGKATFFDGLSQDVLGNIIRLTSSRPHHMYPATFIEPSVILNMCDSSSPFRDSVQSTFRTLSTAFFTSNPGNHEVDFDEGEFDSGLTINEDSVGDIHIALAQLLDLIGMSS